MFTYQANRQISVDNVRHADHGPIKTPPLSDAESNFSEEDSSLTGLSSNDVELDSNEVSGFSETTKSSSQSGQPKPSNLHFFQPISKHEVFFDGNPATSQSKQSKKRHRELSSSKYHKKVEINLFIFLYLCLAWHV